MHYNALCLTNIMSSTLKCWHERLLVINKWCYNWLYEIFLAGSYFTVKKYYLRLPTWRNIIANATVFTLTEPACSIITVFTILNLQGWTGMKPLSRIHQGVLCLDRRRWWTYVTVRVICNQNISSGYTWVDSSPISTLLQRFEVAATSKSDIKK